MRRWQVHIKKRRSTGETVAVVIARTVEGKGCVHGAESGGYEIEVGVGPSVLNRYRGCFGRYCYRCRNKSVSPEPGKPFVLVILRRAEIKPDRSGLGSGCSGAVFSAWCIGHLQDVRLVWRREVHKAESKERTRNSCERDCPQHIGLVRLLLLVEKADARTRSVFGSVHCRSPFGLKRRPDRPGHDHVARNNLDC